jgi:hypothetical protein
MYTSSIQRPIDFLYYSDNSLVQSHQNPTKMIKETSFRSLIALLLTIQALCWVLTLLDLFSPGKPLSVLRHSAEIFGHFAKRSSALLRRGLNARQSRW